ncbi:hypothetical protein OG552_10780 [Streptomyces sp. NBC_01476]|uniref:hypothetical protein n=1 Tax=Streptomyces sp. NBC_01476 TaxID=2903881 RepID=UPI002E2ED784|nr:hypothetical protein [Streptomyces sp. NBC_01476]
MPDPDAPACGAELHHAHGTSVCDLPDGHDGQHEAWCDSCYEGAGYTDPSDRLAWDHNGENWLTPAATPSNPGSGE